MTASDDIIELWLADGWRNEDGDPFLPDDGICPYSGTDCAVCPYYDEENDECKRTLSEVEA